MPVETNEGNIPVTLKFPTGHFQTITLAVKRTQFQKAGSVFDK